MLVPSAASIRQHCNLNMEPILLCVHILGGELFQMKKDKRWKKSIYRCIHETNDICIFPDCDNKRKCSIVPPLVIIATLTCFPAKDVTVVAASALIFDFCYCDSFRCSNPFLCRCCNCCEKFFLLVGHEKSQRFDCHMAFRIL